MPPYYIRTMILYKVVITIFLWGSLGEILIIANLLLLIKSRSSCDFAIIYFYVKSNSSPTLITRFNNLCWQLLTGQPIPVLYTHIYIYFFANDSLYRDQKKNSRDFRIGVDKELGEWRDYGYTDITVYSMRSGDYE